MIAIEPRNNRFMVRFSAPGSGMRGYSEIARDLDEVHALIDHHHRRPHVAEKCPLCRTRKEQ